MNREVPISSTENNVTETSIFINGANRQTDADPKTPLLWVLRDNFGLTGTKYGCGVGQCGACTVLLNGRRINSCLALAVACQGAEIVTIEGIGEGEKLHPVQQAFIEHDAFQCGYCTPGQICSAVGFLDEHRRGPEGRRTVDGGGDPRGLERQSVSLRGLSQYRRRDSRGGGRCIIFHMRARPTSMARCVW